jgi:hypothetical protein
MSGKPDAGNLHVRFDEGDQTHRLVPTLPRVSGVSGHFPILKAIIPKFPEEPKNWNRGGRR